MSLSSTKQEILETMLLHDKPIKPVQIAKETGKKFPSVMMHIIGLSRMGYATSLEKGQYTITEKGKNALGVPEINIENARAILAHTPQDKSFHFYASIGKPTSLHAHGLQDFCDKILKVDVESINFHMSRGDFEAWFEGLGDIELAKRIALLKEKKIVEKEPRKRLYEIVENRYTVLTRLAENAVSPV